MTATQHLQNHSFTTARLAGAVLVALAVIAVGLMDVVSTNLGLSVGAVEVNPVMAFTQAALGEWWFVPKLALQLVTVAILILHPKRQVFACVGAVVVINAVVVANNFAIAGVI